MSEVASTPELLREDELLSFVRAQRWFGAKSSDVAGLRIADTAVLRSEPHRLLDVLVEVRYGSGTHDLYQLVVGSRGAGDGDGPEIASGDGWRSYEAFADPAFARELLHLLRSGATLPTSDGAIEFCAMGTLPQDSSALREVRPLELEQSNSSIVIDDELIVKLYRRLSAGVNPEVELLHFLRSHEFANVPRLEGWWSYVGPLMAASLGVVQRFVPGAIDGWTLALDELRTDPAAFVRRVRRLGEVVGEMHAVLASEPEDQAFAPEEASQESLALLTATVDEEIDDVFLSLPETEAVAPIVGRADAVRDLLRGLSTVGSIGRRIRTHGDLHLGQVLWAAEDWLLIDFEGEPARALPERRLKQSPLRDVAGMLRSFTYATAVAGVADLAIEARAREEFLDGYTHAVQGAAVLPAAETTQRLLRIFELEKAIYELRYELAHRPDWVPVPVNGIVRLLEEEPA